MHGAAMFGLGLSSLAVLSWVILSLAGAVTSIIFVATKVLSGPTRVCRDKIMFIATKLSCLSWQNYVCRDKRFVATKIFCRDKHNFVATNVLSRQAYFCTFILVSAPANDIIISRCLDLLTSRKCHSWKLEVLCVLGTHVFTGRYKQKKCSENLLPPWGTKINR